MSKIYEALERAQLERAQLARLDGVQLLQPEGAQPEDMQRQGRGTAQPRVASLPKARPDRAETVSSADEMISLYQSIESLLPDAGKKVVQFIASREGEGTSTIVREFGQVSAHRLGKRVLIVDANRRNPGQHLAFGIKPQCGWEDILSGSGAIDQAIYRVRDSSLYLCPGSPGTDANHHAFDAVKIERLLCELKERFDLVLVDSPPVAVFPDSLTIARKADGVILVLEAEKTRWPVVESAKNRLQKSGARILGIVFNRRRYYIPEFIYSRL